MASYNFNFISYVIKMSLCHIHIHTVLQMYIHTYIDIQTYIRTSKHRQVPSYVDSRTPVKHQVYLQLGWGAPTLHTNNMYI